MSDIKFKKYEKIHNINKPECVGLLDEEVIIQEKIDGANASIWVNINDGLRSIHVGSRNNGDAQNNDKVFKNLHNYVMANDGILSLLEDFPAFTLYGEWLVKHTIQYDEKSYNEFYLFDIFDNQKNEYIPPDEVNNYAHSYNIKHPKTLFKGKINKVELEKYVGISELGDKGEGIVIKRHNFINKYEDRVYGKLVSEKFKEKNKIAFGGYNKKEKYYEEFKFIDKFITDARIEKIIKKYETNNNKKVTIVDIRKIIPLVIYDTITEECMYFIENKKVINFKDLSKLISQRIAHKYKKIIGV